MTLEQIIFEITYKCNLRCVFCYNVWKIKEYQKKAELTLENYEYIITKLPKANIYALSGGEPLLREDLFEIADLIQNKSKVISLLTSGINITEEVAKQISERDIRTQLPVHGLQEKHDTTTGRKGTFKKLIKAFIHLREYSAIYSTSTVVSKKNIKNLAEILEFCVAMGSRYLLLIRFLPGGAGLKQQHLLLNKEEIKRSYQILDRICGYYGVQGGVGVPNLPCIIDEKQFKHINFSYCNAGKKWFVIGPSGDLRMCNHSPTVYGNILEHDLKNILRNEIFMKFRRNEIFPIECNGCKIIETCRGGCRAVAETMYGDLYKPEPLFKSLYF